MSSPFNFKDTTLIFCDGACSGNPGPGGWGAIVATADGHVRELAGSEKKTTNNKMELIGCIESLKTIKSSPGKVMLCTDSVYVIRGITQWIFGWRKKGWVTSEGKEVANRELWEELSKVVGSRGKNNIDWKFVRGHSGIPGNERCDEIAVAFSKGEFIKLYNGPLIKYEVAIYDIPENTSLPEMKDRTGPKAQAFSYLSLLGGVAMRHKDWPECERRVKGQSGAKFKKAMNASDESEILKSWGINPQKVK